MTTRARWLGDVRADMNAAAAKIQSLTEDIETLRDRATEGNRSLTDGEETRIARLQAGIDRAAEDKAALQDEAQAMVLELGTRSRNTESVDDQRRDSYTDAGREPLDGRYVSRAQLEGAALRSVERHGLTAAAADRLDRVIRDTDTDPAGHGARYIAAVAAPEYERAFWTMLRDPQTAHLRMTPAELASVRRVSEADSMRAMSLTGSAGGFGVPFALDPTIMISSNGAINPIRQLATVTTIAVDEWRGVSSTGVTAAFAAEATETTDNAPTLLQPTISTEKAQAFIPFSIEIGMDYDGLRDELGGLLRDAKDVLEATAFLTGTGTNEPQGILAGLTTTQRVQTDVAATLDIDDVWDLRGTFGSTRFAPSGTFAGNPGMLDRVFRFTPSGSTTEPQAMPDRGGPLMGRPTVEISTMVNTTTTGSKVLLIADFKAAYRIVDRIGLTIELIPHLFGTNHRPTGQRGLYAFWRVGAGVQVANAARYLEVL